MFRGLLIAAIVALGLLVGNPYFSWVVFRVMGEQTVSSINRDNTRSVLVWGPGVAPPDWVPVMPDTLTIKRSRWVEYEGWPSHSGGLELLSHADADAIVAWYTARLTAQGFAFEPAKARDAVDRVVVAVDGEVHASSPKLGVDVRVLVRPRQGILLRPRLVEIQWFDGAIRGAR